MMIASSAATPPDPFPPSAAHPVLQELHTPDQMGESENERSSKKMLFESPGTPPSGAAAPINSQIRSSLRRLKEAMVTEEDEQQEIEENDSIVEALDNVTKFIKQVRLPL